MLKARTAARNFEGIDRERRKRLWLAPLIADLGTPEALELAAQFQVSRRLLADIAGRIVNLNSFLDAGYVYPSAAGIGRMIKNANGQWMSARQVRRGISFFGARGWLRVEHRPGFQNWIFPLYRAAEGLDIVSGDPGHDVQGGADIMSTETNNNKPESKTTSPPTPSSHQFAAGVVGLANRDRRATEKPIEGQEVVQHRLAQRLGSGDVERGFLIIFGLSESCRDQLIAMERVGRLSDVEIASARAIAESPR